MDKELQILREKNRRSVQSWLPNVVFYLQLCVLELLFDPGPRAAEAVMENINNVWRLWKHFADIKR